MGSYAKVCRSLSARDAEKFRSVEFCFDICYFGRLNKVQWVARTGCDLRMLLPHLVMTITFNHRVKERLNLSNLLGCTALLHWLKHEISFLLFGSNNLVVTEVCLLISLCLCPVFLCLLCVFLTSSRQRFLVAPWSDQSPLLQISVWMDFGKRRKAPSESIDLVTRAIRLLVSPARLLLGNCVQR